MNDFPSPDDFPNYNNVDSRIVLDAEDSFNENVANFQAEVNHEKGSD